MAGFWPLANPPIGQYAELQNEREYLLDALSKEEKQALRLLHQLESVRSKLRQDGLSSETTKGLKKSAASLMRRIKRSQRSEKAMIDNLSSATYQAQFSDRGRRTQYEHSASQNQSLWALTGLQSQMQGMSLGSPAFQSLVSPLPQFIYQQDSGSLISPLYSPFCEPAHQPFDFINGQPIMALSPLGMYQNVCSPINAVFPSEVWAQPQWNWQNVAKLWDNPIEDVSPTERVRTMSLPVVSSAIWATTEGYGRNRHSR